MPPMFVLYLTQMVQKGQITQIICLGQSSNNIFQLGQSSNSLFH